MISLSKPQQGALLAVLSGFLYGFLGYFGVSLMQAGLSVPNMLFWRFLIASIFMLLISIPYYKSWAFFTKDSLKAYLSGVFFYSFSTILYFIASQYIGTGLGMVVFFTYPAIVMLLNIVFYKAKINRIYYVAFFFITIGMMCLVDLHEFKFDLFGIQLGLLSALCYGAYIMAGKKINLSPQLSTLLVSLGCASSCLIAALIDTSFYIPNGFQNWFNLTMLATICTAIPILLLLQGLKYISPEKASMLSVLEPVFVLLLGIILLHEPITSLQILGTSIILSGALMTIVRKSQVE